VIDRKIAVGPRAAGDLRAPSRIRLARAADLDALPEIERAASALFTPYGLGALYGDVLTLDEEVLGAFGADRLWVAADGADCPVGFAYGIVVDGQMHLEEIDVHPAHGRRGLGAALVEAVCDRARRDGDAFVTLTTMLDVPFNAPFYEKLGFRVIAEAAIARGLRAVIESERARGFPVDRRVAMRKDLRASDP
jgi:GNAT superfamily N-acetyltransferase